MVRGTMNEKCVECPNKKVHLILGGYFCDLMKRSFCGLEPDTFLNCKEETLNDGESDRRRCSFGQILCRV